MKLINFMKHNYLYCKTCKSRYEISLINLQEHANHDLRIIDKPKWFLIDVAITVTMFTSVLGILLWQLWDVIQIGLKGCGLVPV